MSKRLTGAEARALIDQARENAEIIMRCMMGGCDQYRSVRSCAHCGFNMEENERRKKSPLVQGPDGLWGRYVGIGLYDGKGTMDD